RPRRDEPAALRVRSGRALQSGQGVPDAAAVRRGARPLPRASAGARGGGGAVVIEHEAGDLTCTVEAETPMVELQAALAGAGQMLALDPPGSGLTVGDVFDRGLFGPRAHRYGRPRDLILGIRARLPGGEEIRG